MAGGGGSAILERITGGLKLFSTRTKKYVQLQFLFNAL
jgi:hypothetical protein